MSLHQVSENEHERAAQVNARRLRLGAPIPVKEFERVKIMQRERFDRACLDYFNLCFSFAVEPEFIVQQADDMADAPSVRTIIGAVCSHYSVNPSDLLSSIRTADVVLPRQIVMWIARTITLRSMPDIATRLRKRDHTTVLHGVRKIDRLRKEDPKIAADLKAICSALCPKPEMTNAEINHRARS